MTDEHRRAPRYQARVRVLYFSKGQPRAVDADYQNISTEGLFIKTRRSGPQKGTPVSLLLNFDDAEKELMVEGVVRWQGGVSSHGEGPDRAGMGIQFTEMDAAVREALASRLALLPEP